MKVAALLALVTLAGATAANADQDCASISDSQSRLACYDQHSSVGKAETESAWRIKRRTSPIDDSTTVLLSSDSREPIKDRLGRQRKATLMLRCQENSTSLMLFFAENFMSDLNQYGEVTLRIDDQQANVIRMDESTDHMLLGLWDGAAPVRMIRSLLGHDVLTVRATPFNGTPITAQFPLTGLEEAIKPLRDACHW
ncbi:type VI secretion system-associated protein TagO [Salinicola sp. JS01]|uniref:type VI secretion system-associated protein TagO n=1 Tax=Salinicola sp. JS01 TaxID=3050071 RepID=UPI00255B7483|nr:type VI secretion system-associated protein TagO [Salinicola sp. JS01]WIX31230.1 type VI secretion system-associated protein TagO [Salinicola sp. JS01]